MKYPNAYRGVSRLLLAEILGMFPILIQMFYSKLASIGIFSPSFLLEYMPWIMLGAAVLSGLLRVLALGRAAQNEITFTLGQKLAVFSVLFFLANQYLVPRVIESLSKAAFQNPSSARLLGFLASVIQLVVPLGFVVTFIWVMLNVVAGIRQLAIRMNNSRMETQGRWLTMLIMIVICSVLFMFVIPVIVSKATARSALYGIITLILVLACLAALLVSWIWYLVYLVQARHMLRAKEDVDLWSNPSVKCGPDTELP